MQCTYHLCNNELSGKQRKFCSKSCSTKKGVLTWRKNAKQKAINYLGGSCRKCDYKRCPDALVFHHRDRKEKSFGIAQAMVHIRSWSYIQVELDKCDLLCANCHAETHAGLI